MSPVHIHAATWIKAGLALHAPLFKAPPQKGAIIMPTTACAAELRENPDVKEFYLGMSDEGRKSFRDVRSYRRRKRWLA